MSNLSNNEKAEYPLFNEYVDRIIEYLDTHKDDEVFTLTQFPDDRRFFMRQDKNGYNGISFVYPVPNVCSEDVNSRGYKRICYKGHKEFKHRLIYKTYHDIPDYVNFDDMEVHHKNGNVLDNRLDNLYLISIPNHRILHKFIDKYGIENVEL